MSNRLREALARIVEEVDYDIYKDAYCVETSEDPEDVERNLDRLVKVFQNEVPSFGLLHEVRAEMEAQKEKWGEQNHRDLPLDPMGDDSPNREVQGEILCRQVGVAPESLARQNCERAFRAGNGSWAHILVEEVAEACAEFDDPEALRQELIQSAAVTVSWIEAIDRRKGIPVVDMDGSLMLTVHNGEKSITIRTRHRDYPTGGKVLIRNVGCHRDFRVVNVTGVRHTTFAEITEEEFQADGFSTREKFETGIRTYSPDVTGDSPMTVLRWG